MSKPLGNHSFFVQLLQIKTWVTLRSIDSMVLLMYMAVVKREDLFSGKAYDGNLANPLMSDVYLVQMMEFLMQQQTMNLFNFPFNTMCFRHVGSTRYLFLASLRQRRLNSQIFPCDVRMAKPR